MNSFSVSTTMLLAAVCGASASAQCQYELISTPPYDCGPSSLTEPYTAMGMNNLGAWAGFRQGCASDDTFLPVYRAAGRAPQVLPLPPGTSDWGAQATAVNDAGVVVGYFDGGPSGGVQKGCVWWPSGKVDELLPSGSPAGSAGKDINNSNAIVGWSGGKPFVLVNGEMTIIPVPPGLLYGFAWSVSDTGYVAGYFEGLSARAFRWKDGSLSILQPLPSHPISRGLGVNDAGEVVGDSRTQSLLTITPTLWQADGTPIELELPPGYTRGAATLINNHGVIIGEIDGPGLSLARVIWLEGVCHLINDLTVPGSPSIGTIADINQVGQIMTDGAKRLTPVGQSPGDLNGDCAVDGSDLVVVLADWGPREWSIADINSDGVVDGNDLVIVLGHWTGS